MAEWRVSWQVGGGVEWGMREPRPLPVGKLPADLLATLLEGGAGDPRVLLGPGIGLDCAVIEAGDPGGERLLVLKSDPITFVSDALGHYLVQVNANDVATTGAVPRWLLVTLLLPEGRATAAMAEDIMAQIRQAAAALAITVVGGHSEVTHGLEHPLVAGALVGEVARDALVTPRGAAPGNRVLLTKGVPVEGTAILARELPERLAGHLDARELECARDFLYRPGIGVTRDARVALTAGRVTAMHDPTEGGLLTALWELAEASGHGLAVDLSAVPVPDLARRVCGVFGIDPLATIASGALLLTAAAEDAGSIAAALIGAGIACADIGAVVAGPPRVTTVSGGPVPRPARDAIALVFEA